MSYIEGAAVLDSKVSSDAEQVKKILTETHNSDATVTDIRRLGPPKTKKDKPRPLRVSFSNEKERDNVLAAAYKISKESRNSQEKNEKTVVQVSLRIDLTKWFEIILPSTSMINGF